MSEKPEVLAVSSVLTNEYYTENKVPLTEM